MSARDGRPRWVPVTALIALVACTRPETAERRPGPPETRVASTTTEPLTTALRPTSAPPKSRRPSSDSTRRLPGRGAWRFGDEEFWDVEVVDGVVIASGSRRTVVLPPRCNDRCRPLWTAPGTLVTVEGGHAFVTSGPRSVAAYPLRCRADGAVCTPTAHSAVLNPAPESPEYGSEEYISAAAVDNGIGYIAVANNAVGGKPDSARARIFAVDFDCAGTCPILWRSPLLGAVRAPPVVSDGRLYVAATSGLHAFPLKCSQLCAPVWEGTARALECMSIAPPVVLQAVVVLTATLSVGGCGRSARVAAYPKDCGAPACLPSWRYDFNGPFAGAPQAFRGRLYMTLEGRVVAFAQSCIEAGGRCTPVWEARRLPSFVRHPLLTSRYALVSGRGGRLAAYPHECKRATSTGCRPAWRVRIGGQYPSGIVAERGSAFVVAGRVLWRFPLRCRLRCEPEAVWKSNHRVNDWVVAQKRAFFATPSGLVAVSLP